MIRKYHKIFVAFLVSCALLILIAVACLVLIPMSLQFPYEYVKTEALKRLDGQEDITLIYEEKRNEDEWIVIYKDQRNEVSCVLLKKKFLSYQVIEWCGKMPLDYEGDYLYFGFRNNESDESLIFGMLSDATVTSVTLDGYLCSVCEVPNRDTRIYWIWADYWGAQPNAMPVYEEIK